MQAGCDSVSLVVEEEKHGMSVSIPTLSSLGGARPVAAFMPCTKGRMAHCLPPGQHCLVVGSLESNNTRLFRGLFLGNVPTRLEAFPALFVGDVTLPKAVGWLPVPSYVEIADTLGNAVTFLPTALRGGTRTLFSSQGTAHVFFLKEQKVEMLRTRAEAVEKALARCRAELRKDQKAKVAASQIKELQRFAKGLERDKAAVLAGLTLVHSNGQVEGQVTRIKLIKRMMFGRAGFALLRQRVLHAL